MTHLGSWLRPLSALFARLNGTLPGIAIMGVEHGDASGNKTEKYLALQLRSPFYVGSAGFGLMCASPDGPCDDVGGPDASLRKTNSDAPDFLN